MGHDIHAYRIESEDEREALYQATCADLKDHAWARAYEKHKQTVEVAYLRRNAFDEWNKAIYVALDATDLYAGCSGNGDQRRFTMADLKRASQILSTMSGKEPPEREPNLADELFSGLFRTAPLSDKVKPGDTYDTLAPEIEFVDSCIQWLRETGKTSITVRFG